MSSVSDDYKPVLRAGSDPVVFFKYPGQNESGNISIGHVMAAAMAHSLGMAMWWSWVPIA